ncbi:hypothetical protein EYZ11_001938 [Aspergillus tanneri]|uniref:AMMECR1 domain-containing protein n=1 Tax=Aspergillus tanneri TaxID=1220188 RepID=A0A4S3JS87_9EURO|nr:uncharacterized protein ATNIH1004_007481 [Aspergillus tanneri]KAA8646058.1 hypothetical protein ATNIH1004_007481 [Aspergillus tanneri]THC98586.1 hypothetical protein EYZ11_001938 [Aspergillus tanneri]
MASPAQCYFCFECLAASYEDSTPISLELVEELWERHEQFKKIAALEDNDESVSLRESEGLNQQIVDEDNGDDNGLGASLQSRNHRLQAAKPPAANRLQCDSSLSTTPSSNSSRSVLSSSTAVTTPNSQSTLAEPEVSRGRIQKDRRHPLFVTWNTLSKSGRKFLRGCIGTFEAQELSAGLKEYALKSALEDSRFSPIPASLLPALSCSLTLLGTFEPCTNAMDWILGLHGLRISFIHRGRRYGATYLPDVPVEQGWTKEQTVKSLMDKAGWTGSTEGTSRKFLRGSSSTNHGSNSSKPWEQVSDFRAVKYQGLKAAATYAEWQEWREWVLSLEDGEEKFLNPSV